MTQTPTATSLVDTLARLTERGLSLSPHPYDAERFEQARQVCIDLIGDNDTNRWACALEGLAKTGYALTTSAECRDIYVEIESIARSLSGGHNFFGPASPPRTTSEMHPNDLVSRYRTPGTMVLTLVMNESKLLLIRRSDSGLWSPPGGFCDPGLSGAENAVKEAEEESGIQVEISALLGVFDLSQRFVHECLYALVFAAQPTGGELAANQIETTDVDWFDLDSIPTHLHMDGDPWLQMARDYDAGKLSTAYFDEVRPSTIDLTRLEAAN